MNDEELDIIADWHGIGGEQTAKMSALKKNFQLDMLVVTRGKDGAISLGETGFCSHTGCAVKGGWGVVMSLQKPQLFYFCSSSKNKVPIPRAHNAEMPNKKS